VTLTENDAFKTFGCYRILGKIMLEVEATGQRGCVTAESGQNVHSAETYSISKTKRDGGVNGNQNRIRRKATEPLGAVT